VKPAERRWCVLLGCLFLLQLSLIALLCSHRVVLGPLGRVQLPAFGLSLVLLAVLRRAGLSRSALVRLLLLGCACLQLAALSGHPNSSDDHFRYAWDAKVQLAGIDPYRYAPADPALLGLRDGFTFPEQEPCRHNQLPDGCTTINRPTVHTIYPPVAQLAFDAVWVLSFGGSGGHLPLQIAAALGVLATTFLLIRLTDQRRAPLWPVAVWAWSPVVAIEATNNAHIEWLAALLAVCGLLSLRAGRPITAGAAIGAAIATKLYPGLLLVTAGRRPWKLLAAATAVLVLGYLPHVIAVGPEVLGYLPGYLREENYDSGARYIVIGWLTGQWLAGYLAPAVLVAVLGWLWWRAEPSRPEHTAVAAAGAYLIVTTPNYSWYALILVAMVAASGQLRWLWLCIAPTMQYKAAELHVSPELMSLLGYGVGTAVVLLVSLRERAARSVSDHQHDGKHGGRGQRQSEQRQRSGTR
jgi:alpha-1,2-mannosyltransferase